MSTIIKLPGRAGNIWRPSGEELDALNKALLLEVKPGEAVVVGTGIEDEKTARLQARNYAKAYQTTYARESSGDDPGYTALLSTHTVEAENGWIAAVSTNTRGPRTRARRAPAPIMPAPPADEVTASETTDETTEPTGRRRR